MATTMRAGTPEAAPARRPPRLDRRKLRQTPVALLFLAPALVVITLFHFFPIFYAFWLSLRNYRLIDQGMVWFKNYNTALHSHDFWLSLGNTIYYVLGTVPLTMALREQADEGTPLVFTDPDDPAAQGIRQAARGLVALSPIELPVMQDPSPAAAPQPVGMSLPMA